MMSMIKNARARDTMYEVVAEGFENLCLDVAILSLELANKFENGAGEKLKEVFKK